MAEEGMIGILGGMGPEATLELFRLIIKLTPTPTGQDQEHFHIVIDNNTKVPDRTRAIEQNGPDSFPFLRDSAERLQKSGADFIVIPCNTAHYWLNDLRRSVDIPIVDMIGETAGQVWKVLKEKAESNSPNIGLLATTGTLKTGLYQKALYEKDIRVIKENDIRITSPSGADQEKVMKIIHEIKAGRYSSKEALIDLAHGLMDRGAEVVVLGCTELPLLLKDEDLEVPVFNPLDILARKAIALASC